MVKIAVEHPFTDIRRALQKKGYQADMVDQTTDGAGYDVLVIRNQDVFRGSRTAGALVETRGRSVNEVVEEVEERLQRAERIAGKAHASKSSSDSDGGFTAGFAIGALIGSAAAFLLAPKSGKEMQNLVKEKVSSGNSDSSEDSGGKLSQVKEKATDLAEQAKEKTSGITDQVKEKANNIKEQKGSTDENDAPKG